MYELYTLDFYKKYITNPYSDKNSILFGAYDNIKFSPIKTYEDAEKMISISQYNIMDRTRRLSQECCRPDYPTSMIVLYSLEENNIELWLTNFDLGRNLDFLSIVLFSPKNRSADISHLSDEIHKIVSDDKDIVISCFGTFGMYDMCIIIRSNSIEKVVDFIDKIYDINNGETINTSYTIVNYVGKSMTRLVMGNNQDNYVANIQITCTCKKARKNILLKLKEYLGDDYNDVSSYAVLGEFDLCIHIPANKLLLNLYQENGIFNSDSGFYKKNIIQSCTRISKKEEINDTEKEELRENNSCCFIENKTENDDVHNEILNKFQHLIDNNEMKDIALKRILQLAYVDFCKAYFIAHKSCSIMDLECQFKSTIDCIGQTLNRENCYEVAAELAEMLSKKIYTVIQENNYTIVEPYSYLYNTGILQDIIHMYESFIKKFLAIIYAHCSIKQSELIPVVLIDAAVNIPISDLFIYNEDENFDDNSNKKADQLRIISIKLPLDVILRPEMYLPLLVHEVIHYLCPYNRILRNEIILRLYLEHYFLLMLHPIFDEKGYIFYDIIPFISSWFDKNIDSIKIQFESYKILDFESKSLTFSSQVESLFDSAFSKYGRKDTESLVCYKILEIFAKDFQNEKGIHLFEDINELCDLIIRQGKNKEYILEIKDISDGLKELVCDLFMCRFFDLDLVSYFSLIVVSILNQNLYHEPLISVAIRFGGILTQWVHNPKEFDIKCYREKIINMVGNFNPTYRNKINDINKIFEMLDECINLFSERFIQYSILIEDYINCYNIESYNSSSDILDNASDIDLKSFVEVLETVCKIFKNFQFDELSEENYSLKNTIKLIQFLPNDLSLNRLNNFYKKCQSFKEENGVNENIKYIFPLESSTYILNDNNFVNSTDIYIENSGIENAIKLAQKILIDSEYPKDCLWYRGQLNSEWGVAPVLYRHCNNDFRDKLIDAYELFRAQACESLEIHTNIDSDSDWIACMQHYFVPTHFLDWSEQPLTSLYFALENYFDYPCKHYKGPIPECDGKNIKLDYMANSSLFVLNPNKMNRILSGLNGVPNISIPKNEMLYKNYILPSRGDTGVVEIKSSKDFFSQPSSEKGYWKYMPMAVITSQLNSRIKAQKGHFVAYDLQVNYPLSRKEEENKINDYSASSICDLYSIQNELRNICLIKGTKFTPFMAKIIIPYNLKEDVYNTLTAYGINKSSFYPELMHIGADVSKIVF